MKIAITLLLGLLAMAGIAWFFVPSMDPATFEPRTDLPWQVERLESGDSRVFDLVLGRARLADARAKFGRVDGVGLYLHGDGSEYLEVYFPDVRLGLLKAKVVVGLDAPEGLLQKLRKRPKLPQRVAEDVVKYEVEGEVAAQLDAQQVRLITFIPGSRKLDAAFFHARLGAPTATRRENEHAVSWFYPDRGLSLMIDEEGSEALEFTRPADYSLPADAIAGAPEIPPAAE